MPREMDLGGSWELLPVTRFDGKYDTLANWREVKVPGHWQDLPELESYTGKVVYRKRFKFRPETDRRLFLRLGGVFYWATVYLNGIRLGSNEGYFFPVDYEVTGLLAKENTLLVEVDCPEEANKAAKRMITGVFHHWDALDPKTNPGGIWLPVEIIGTGPARIRDPLFTTAYLAKEAGSARILGQAAIDTPGPERLLVRISFLPRTFEGRAQVFEKTVFKPGGVQTYHYHLDVKEPTLWWTHDHGRPDLYTLRLEVFREGQDQPSDTWETPFGIRTIEMRDYIASLNGRRIYLRGNNYPPGDTRLGSMTRERCQEDARLAREGNLNLLRVHAHVDHPEFYRACDEQGLLLWQDFPLQWYYCPEVETQALRQVERVIFHLGNHPSIGVWCMHNEPFRMFDTRKPFGPLAVARALFSALVYSRNRDRMDQNLARKTRFLDPHRFTAVCSGETGLGRPAGDAHYYYGWYLGPLHWFHAKYRKHPERLKFITEFGAQSFPNLESSRRFMSEDLKQINWKLLEARHSLQRLFLFPRVHPKRFNSLPEFIAATQDYQSRLNRFHVDRIRALKYKPNGGCVAFMFLDPNPAVQWSVVDYYRAPKSSYYALRQAMSPVYAFTIIGKPGYRLNDVLSIPVYAVNDTWEEAKVEVNLSVISPVGETVLEKDYTESLPADSEALALGVAEVKLRWSGHYRVRIRLQGPQEPLKNEYRVKVK